MIPDENEVPWGIDKFLRGFLFLFNYHDTSLKLDWLDVRIVDEGPVLSGLKNTGRECNLFL